jgi:radical SAM/Cys-rich protein
MKKSLKSQGSSFVAAQNQIKVLSEVNHIPKFADKLRNYDMFPLRPKQLEILQVNVGYMCNQTCDHCHVDAGPDRKEIMQRQTMNACLSAIDNSSIKTVDLTGGAPEMNPHFVWFVEELSKRDIEIIVRSNLTILVSNKKYDCYPEFFKKHNVTVIASLPCYTLENTDKQRGNGVFKASIEALLKLNAVGYGKLDSSLKLNLVFNPGGPSLPPDQLTLEADYKKQLSENFDIDFNYLFTITNLPVSRFLDYLLVAGKYEEYLTTLVNAFNVTAAENVMCRNTLSVGYDGRLFDCDFNQMLDLDLASPIKNINEFNNDTLNSRSIVLNNHCYGCTAGAGSSCQGSTA